MNSVDEIKLSSDTNYPVGVNYGNTKENTNIADSESCDIVHFVESQRGYKEGCERINNRGEFLIER